jgi:antitoxin (DNA-binding transcriptional repressor) of toxin-antitoxin stability system
MVRISLDEMSRDPGKYIREVEAGETVVVTRADRAVAEIRPVAAGQAGDAKAPRPAGLAAGEFRVPDDFDEPLPPDVLEAFEGTSGL